MRSLLFVFIGGGAGSVLRYLLSVGAQRFWIVKSFPLGTFLANIIGCFLIGVLVSALVKSDLHLRLLLITGFCGGFTTFSAFSVESVSLWQSGQFTVLAIYILLSVILGLAAVWLGQSIVKW
ncbi:fluoride efflux transporter CrcB [Kaistella rhinocerotis]|uniref:fluoride efflux transporter CrcB n=1 Tax=Kaistella rhinocerotis TaxID=3026437 RepID=UPI00255241A3|nr:fluoride efflux transporter CrcB [Kaistella sp. Ran72]